MKRLISMLTAIAVLILSAVFVLPAAAASEYGTANFTLSDVDNVNPGESFTVTLHISGDYQAHGMNLSLEYDPTCMVLESCEYGDYMAAITAAGNLVTVDNSTLSNSGMIKIGIMCPINAATGEGDMLIMHFHVKEGVEVNQQVIMIVTELIYLPLGSMTSDDVAFTTDNAIITLANGSAPDDGYNEGGSGVGSNTSESPNYPTRDPNDPDAQTTPQPVETSPLPTASTSASPSTREPIGTPAPMNTPENTDPADEEQTGTPESAQPGGKTDPGSVSTQIPEQEGEKTEDEGTKKTVLICVAGALVLAAAAAVTTVVVSKKKKH